MLVGRGLPMSETSPLTIGHRSGARSMRRAFYYMLAWGVTA
jgi:hypothetical protein